FWSGTESLTNRVVRVIYRDHENNLWFGCSPGLVLDSSSKKFLEKDEIRCLAEDQHGTLWVGTSEGLYHRDKNGAFRPFKMRRELAKNAVLALYADQEGNLWASIANCGLACIQNGRLSICTMKQGLWNDEIFEILEDDHGWLWMSCPKGVFRVNKTQLADLNQGLAKTITCIAYGKTDGMESIQCSGVSKPAAWRSRDGRLWFATAKGLAVTNPNEDLVLNEKPPTVRIEEVLIDKRLINFSEDAPLQIKSGRGELEIHYTALSFQMPEKNHFRYRLGGVDPEWVDAGNRRVAYYNNLRPGSYVFQVRACNNDGVWNEKPAEFEMTLLPHFWQLKWFSGFAALAIAGMIGVTVRYATRKKLERKLEGLEQQNAIEKERTRIAQDMHDDLGARLTEILLLNELARKNKQSSDNLENYLGKQSHVVRDVADSLDTIVWAVNPTKDTLDSLANYLYEQVERLLTMKSIRCRFDVPDQLPSCFISSEVRHNVFLTVRESLNNVIKHSGATEVWFRLRHSSASLSIVIEDNGKGISPAERSACGNGLQNMERRMKNLGGSFRLSSHSKRGTQIRLEVPLRPVPEGTRRFPGINSIEQI
ncbi:MAG TPA: two-component regulator propeller domain-containing protein, partial [Verrucomicrobiae bacterium]|nr:two-component regulator propeller domain-containing protein [Verrucomicrobiae bacterium]